MMGERRVAQGALFYEFSLERHVPADHWVRAIDRFVDLSEILTHLRPFYSEIGRPSVDPELMIRMLLVGYCFGIRSERRLCEEANLDRPNPPPGSSAQMAGFFNGIRLS
jgi:transposase